MGSCLPLFMQFIQGKDRTQMVLYTGSLDQIVERDNEVRLIDAFVERINAFTKRFISKIRSLKLMTDFALPFSLLLSYRFKIAYIY